MSVESFEKQMPKWNLKCKRFMGGRGMPKKRKRGDGIGIGGKTFRKKQTGGKTAQV